nr:hypothetical protein [Candidatus Sigynarchaeota archaeon]
AGFLFTIIAVFGAQLLFTGLIFGSARAGSGDPSLNVLYLAPSEDVNHSSLYSAITLDPSLAVTTSFSGNFSGYDCVVVDADYPGMASVKSSLLTYVHGGGGLILVASPALIADPSLLVDLGIIIAPSVSENTKLATVDTPVGTESHNLSRKVEWNSMPEMANYTAIQRDNINTTGNTTTILLERFLQIDEALRNETKDPLLVEKQLGNGRVLYHAGYLGNPKEINYQVKIWPYFNYMFYASMQYMVNTSLDYATYGKWEYSPVPHSSEQLTIGIYVCAMLIIAFALFFIVKRVSARTRLDQASLEAAKVETKKDDEGIEIDEGKRKIIADLMASGKNPEEIEAEISKLAQIDLSDKWEQVGTHKQISGFLFGFFMGIIVLIPQLVVVGILLPQYILPFPQVNGWMDLTRNFFSAIWTAFDVGTSVALAKYFSQYRIHQPDKAIHYAQIFVWWQMLSGILQIFIVAFIGAIIFPQTYLAH